MIRFLNISPRKYRCVTWNLRRLLKLIEYVKDYLRSFDTSVIGATGSNSNQVIDFIKEIDANPDRVYYICYLIINTLRVASLKALRECAIEKAVQFS